MARQLRGGFDTAYVLPNSIKSALLPWLAGIPRRVGYVGEHRYGLLNTHLPNPPKGQRPPMVEFYSAMGGESVPAQDRPRLQVPAAQTDQVLQAYGLQRGAYVVFVPGAEYGPAKRWPVQRFAELAPMLNAPVCVLGSGKEAGLGAQIAALAPTCKVFNLAGQTRLEEAFALIAAAKAVVTNDTGLMHVAAALDVRQVAIFGSSSPLHTPPLSDKAKVIWLKDDAAYTPLLDCAPCFERSCPLGHLRCLNDVHAERVAQWV
jgi:heptosyltransferase-2